ncbi:deoxynucleoside kinase [Athalassotoga saccharophila]|uniref:deoxynucleoside kinase n=1 Tax=Athalassotoga saccharophila TaxID=1441386 RepID=UPI001379C197|nr:deoxynucleoside kinase [Athalassotoga saccharophila]BBJ27458.1 deoxyguanosine kinase [Athalassotoga saccharophila]
MKYICVEGVIGVGKTTLTRMISQRLPFEPVLEIVEENPFLANFYKDRERWAFQTQIFFLMSRYTQQNYISKMINQKNIVSDYTFKKDKIFAELNLEGDQLWLYNKVFDVIETKTVNPDIIIYLKASIETILKRIELRDRTFEREIDISYLESLSNAYDNFFKEYGGKYIEIDADSIDFVKYEEDLDFIISKLKEEL